MRPEFKSLSSEAEIIKDRLNKLRYKRNNDVLVLQRAWDRVQSFFKTMRQRVIEAMDKLEKESFDEMERLRSSLEEGIQLDIDSTTDVFNKIEKLLDDIQVFGDDSETFAFQSFKNCQKALSTASELLATTNLEDYQLQYTPPPGFKQILTFLETPGHFCVSPSLPSPEPGHIYTITNKESCNLGTNEDTCVCWVTGLCKLPGGQTAIVDRANCKVKLLGASTLSVTAQLQLSSSPYDICYISNTELAITVTKVKQKGKKQTVKSGIHFINVTHEGLDHAKSVKTKHTCKSIAYYDSQLYVCSDNALYVYSVSGQFRSKIFEDTTSTDMVLHKVCPSLDGNTIYITDYARNLILTLDQTGQLLYEVSDPEFECPTGVCLADNGAVFVCCQDSHVILQVDREGKKTLNTMAYGCDGVAEPQALCFDQKKRQMLVAQGRSNNLLVFKLK